MKVLWLTMTVPPEANAQIGGEHELMQTGGWIIGLAHYLCKESEIELAIASVSNFVKETTIVQGERVKYYIAPSSDGSMKQEATQSAIWKEIYDNFSPDIVHIHGTEFHHALTWIKANGAHNTVVSIQGLVSVYYYFYNSGLSSWDIISNITLRDLYRGTLFNDARSFKKRGEDEIKIVQCVNNIIGRTHWDRAHSWSMNSNAKYHFCNEILRREFYNAPKWNYNSCTPFTIFVNQSSLPYKGFHMLLRAMPKILEHYPNTQIRVAGYHLTSNELYYRIRRTGYGRLLLNEIKNNNLGSVISFVGRLPANGMISEYLNANVFVCPSAIENSPNALGEAQLLGVPCVASNVGGVSDMIPDDDCGKLYRFSEPTELAFAICSTFEESMKFDNSHEIKVALERHSPQINVKQLINIYNTIMSETT